MKACLIYNPASGHNRRKPEFLKRLRRLAKDAPGSITLLETQGPGHAVELARLAAEDGFHRVIAVGGDGTMNETAQGLVNSGCALALVPCGSGNGLALHLGIPTNTEDALSLALSDQCRIRCMDTGLANGHAFFNVMGMGLDAEISLRFNRLTRRGLNSYVKTTLGALLRHRPTLYKVQTELGETLETKALLVSIANSSQYGNNAIIAPGARVDDGVLDLVALQPMGPVGLCNALIRLFKSSLHRHPRVRVLRGASLLIERAAPGPIHTDGETHDEAAEVRIQCLPSSLRILVPQERT